MLNKCPLGQRNGTWFLKEKHLCDLSELILKLKLIQVSGMEQVRLCGLLQSLLLRVGDGSSAGEVKKLSSTHSP